MSTTQPAGSLVPASTAQGVAAAVATVKEKLAVLVEARLEEFQEDVDAVAASAAFLEEVTDDAGAEDVADKCKRATKLARELDESRKELTRRLDDLKSEIKGPFDKKIAIAQGAATALKASAEPFLIEKDRKAEEERQRVLRARRQAEEEARKEAEERRLEAEKKQREADEIRRREAAAQAERERIAREAEQAKTKKQREVLAGQQRKADEEAAKLAGQRAIADDAAATALEESTVADEVAEAVSAPVTIAAQSAGVKSASGAGLGITKVWQHRVVDEALLPIEAWTINHDWIAAQYANESARARIADKDGVPQIPGVLIFRGAKVAGRA